MTFSKFIRTSSLSLGFFMLLQAEAQAGAVSSDLQRNSPAESRFQEITSTIGDETVEGAQSFIDGMSQKALAFLADTSMTKESKTEAFRHLLESSFDMETIGRFALGRYWRTATPEQRKEYQSLFGRMVIKVYSDRFQDYKGEKFVTRNVRAESDKDILVSSFIVPANGPEVQVDWRVRYKNGGYRIVDVIVEGVSMTVTQRSDFASVIQRGGGNVSVLLDYLREQAVAP